MPVWTRQNSSVLVGNAFFVYLSIIGGTCLLVSVVKIPHGLGFYIQIFKFIRDNNFKINKYHLTLSAQIICDL